MRPSLGLLWVGTGRKGSVRFDALACLERTGSYRPPLDFGVILLHTSAYWLMGSLRRLMPARSSWRVAQFDILRLHLLKIAARVIAWKIKVLVHLPSAYPDQAILRLVLERLPRLVI